MSLSRESIITVLYGEDASGFSHELYDGEFAFANGGGSGKKLFIGSGGDGTVNWVGAIIQGNESINWYEINEENSKLATQYAILKLMDSGAIENIRIKGYLEFYNGIDPSFYTRLSAEEPTAENLIILPNASGEIALVPGTDTQVVFNDGGVLGGDSGFTYNKSSDSLTLAGDLVVNGGDITTSAKTATAFNTTATNLSVGGAATTLTLGATSGTANIRNATLNLGNTTATVGTTSGASANHLTLAPYGEIRLQPTSNVIAGGAFFPSLVIQNNDSGTGQVQISGGNLYLGRTSSGVFSYSASSIIFEGATDDGFETTVTLTDPTADRTITLPDASGTVALVAGSDSQVIFNSSGALGADSDFTYNSSTNVLTINGGTTWHSSNDGESSGLDADLVHGVSGSRLNADISTGVIYGGVISATLGGSTFDISAGIGQIVTRSISGSGASTSVAEVIWSTSTGISISNIATSQFTYVYIDSAGDIQQQTTPFTDTQYKEVIVVGVICHIDYSSVNLVTNTQNISFQDGHRLLEFVDIFGPIKRSGLVISGNTVNTMRVDRSSGSVFKIGSNYNSNASEPDIVNLSAKTPASLCRVYQDGSGGYVFDTNSGSYYTDIDASNYDDGTGTLATVNNNQWSIQRLYFFPNNPDDIICYYGVSSYNSYASARDSVFSEEFSEASITAENAVYLGSLIVRGGASDLGDTADAVFIQSGFFRGSSGGGAGGSATYANLDDLNDVVISSPLDGDVLQYDDLSGTWINSPSSGSATPGGSDTYVQFNDGGSSLGGDSGLTFDKNNDILYVGGNVGVGKTDPTWAMDINSSIGANLRLIYNSSSGTPSNYINFAVSSSGDLTITPSGGDTNLNSNLNMADYTISQLELKDYCERSSSPSINAKTLALSLDLSQSQVFSVSLNNNINSISISNIPDNANSNAVSFILILTGDGNTRSITWPASIQWSNGISPIIVNDNSEPNIFKFTTINGGTSWYGVSLLNPPQEEIFSCYIDASPDIISTGVKAFRVVPYRCRVVEWYVISGNSGTISFDVNSSSFANYPLTSSIVGGGDYPSLSSEQTNSNNSVSGWTDLESGDVIEFEITSNTDIINVGLYIKVRRIK